MGPMGAKSRCELQPTKDPLIGQILVTRSDQKELLDASKFPARFKPILKSPIEETKAFLVYEFDLTTTPVRDLFSEFVEAIRGVLEVDAET